MKRMWISGLLILILAGAYLPAQAAVQDVMAANLDGLAQETSQGTWVELGTGHGTWSNYHGVVSGYVVDGDSILSSTRSYTDLIFGAIIKSTDREASLAFRIQDAANCYLVGIIPRGTSWLPSGQVFIKKRVGYEETMLAKSNYSAMIPDLGQSVHLEVIVLGRTIAVLLDGIEVLETRDSSFNHGTIGFRIYGSPGYPCHASFRHVIIYDLSPRP